MPTNDGVEMQKGPANDFTEGSAVLYINEGPYFDKIEGREDKIYNTAITEIIAMEIHSSIDSFYRYGYVVIPDNIGFREIMPLTGNEIISIRYANTLTAATFSPKVIHFNIYDMEEVSLSNDNRDKYTHKAIKLHLIEAPFFLLFNQKVWSRAYGSDDGKSPKGQKINTIFSNHITNDLKLNNKLIDIDFKNMSTEMHWCIPFWKPQKTFNYLLQFARDENNAGNVKFFTTSNINSENVTLNLKSIDQMFKDATITSQYDTVNVGPMNQSAQKTSIIGQKSLDYLIDVKFLSYDLTSLVTGLGGGHVYNRDYQTGEYFISNDDYVNSNRNNKYFGQFGLWSDSISDWETVQHRIGTFSTKIATDYLNNRIIDQKYQLRCVSNTYLNHTRNCGDKVYITFPSASSAVNENQLIDEQMSGEWIIHEMIDYYQNGRVYSNVSFIKDSFYNTPRGEGNEQKLPNVDPIAPMAQQNNSILADARSATS